MIRDRPRGRARRLRSDRATLVAIAVCAGCGVRTPARIDVMALVKKHGAVEARRELDARIVEDPKDVGARLALAALDEQTGRPGGAIAQLELVVAIGGPLGTRWHAEDRARLARLLAARGRSRLARGAATALADLTRARELGARVDAAELAKARAAHAIDQLRHVDGEVRTAGKQALAELASTAGADPSWRGASAGARLAERGMFGVWLWQRGARRAAWEELRAWHDGTSVPRDLAIAPAYLAARTWWTPVDAPPPAASDLVGPLRCRFPQQAAVAAAPAPRDAVARNDRVEEPGGKNGHGGGARVDAPPAPPPPAPVGSCNVVELARSGDEAAIAAVFAAPPGERATTPAEATAWLTLALPRALRGELAWGPTLAVRVDVTRIAAAAIAPPLRATYARLAGQGTSEREVALAPELSAQDRLAIAAGRALRGAPIAEVRGALAALADTSDGHALIGIVTPPSAEAIARPYATAVVAYAHARVTGGPDAVALRRIVDGYLRDPAVADRISQQVADEAIDSSRARAAIGAVFGALGDPARARTAWQAAVDGSAESDHLTGLAETIARADDPDAALIAATTAAAASGDPAVVWVAVARALDGTGEYQHALEAARSAIDLASIDVLPDALAVAASASRSLGRVAQADALAAQRARLRAGGAQESWRPNVSVVVSPRAPDESTPPGDSSDRRPEHTTPGVAPPIPTTDSDPTDVEDALADYRGNATAAGVARLWVASRWNPRDVAARAAIRAAIQPDDPRRAVIDAELVALAADRDAEIARAAVTALRY